MPFSEDDFRSRVSENPYPGRGLVVGLSSTSSEFLIVYWIMGRSANSRNRVFLHDGQRLWTEAADPSKVQDPSLIIYNAMLEHGGKFVVTNGDQTDTIVAGLHQGAEFHTALRTREYEPDAPNFTPRISGMLDLSLAAKPQLSLSVLRRATASDACDRHLFEVSSLPPGVGFALTTYEGDGNPLPSFSGEPLRLPLVGDAEAVAALYWAALNENNKVSLAVKAIDPTSGKTTRIVVHNKYQRI